MSTDLVVNPDDIQNFFDKTIPDQIHLTAIDPEKSNGAISRNFGTNAAAAQAWALARNGERQNIYYAVNCIQEGLNKRSKKDDIIAIRFAHVDIDPPKGSPSFNNAQKDAAYNLLRGASPSAVIWSGNGWQALWRLVDVTSIKEAEEINRGLIAALGGDKGTHDASRLLRVPGLINWPSKQKRACGREPTLAYIKAEDDGLVSDAKDLMERFPVVLEKADRDRMSVVLGDWVAMSADRLGLASHDALRSLIDTPNGDDRSLDTFAFTCEALRRGLTEEQIAGILLNPDNAVSAHCLDQNDPRRAVERTIGAALAEEDVHQISKKYERERERRLAAGEHDEPHDETRLWTLEAMLRECVFIEDGAQVADTTRPGHILSQSDFRASTAASKTKVTVVGKAESKRVVAKQTAAVWMEHVDRRSVATVTFRPGAGAVTLAPGGQIALNSWGGLRFATPPDDWQTGATVFQSHVRWLFGDDTDAFLDWLAHIAQKPGDPPSFAFLHIARSHGMGRNWIASVMGRVFFGYTALAFDLSGTLRSGYNGVLAGKVLAIVDEIDEGNSQRKYQIQQELKQIITEETRTINPKYGRQHREWNCCRVLIFSNSPAALPLEEDDRRIHVVECEKAPQPPEYYRKLYGLRSNPTFIASVAEFLMQRDISQFNAGQRPPLTRAKTSLLERCRSEAEQILHNVVAKWPVDVITNEELYELMGEDRPKGLALRHAIDRAGVVRVRDWKGALSIYGSRTKVIAYALRNAVAWKTAGTDAIRAELGRIDFSEKEDALFHD